MTAISVSGPSVDRRVHREVTLLFGGARGLLMRTANDHSAR
jgi:hypothetical protein